LFDVDQSKTKISYTDLTLETIQNNDAKPSDIKESQIDEDLDHRSATSGSLIILLRLFHPSVDCC